MHRGTFRERRKRPVGQAMRLIVCRLKVGGHACFSAWISDRQLARTWRNTGGSRRGRRRSSPFSQASTGPTSVAWNAGFETQLSWYWRRLPGRWQFILHSCWSSARTALGKAVTRVPPATARRSRCSDEHGTDEAFAAATAAIAKECGPSGAACAELRSQRRKRDRSHRCQINNRMRERVALLLKFPFDTRGQPCRTMMCSSAIATVPLTL